MAESKKPFDFRSLATKPKKPDFSPSDFQLDEGRRVLPAAQPPAAAPAPKPEAAPAKPKEARQEKKVQAAKPAAGQGGVEDEARAGRPTYKAPNTECVRMVFVLPVETKQLLKQALGGQFFGKYATQVELVDAAIRAFVANGGK